MVRRVLVLVIVLICVAIHAVSESVLARLYGLVADEVDGPGRRRSKKIGRGH